MVVSLAVDVLRDFDSSSATGDEGNLKELLQGLKSLLCSGSTVEPLSLHEDTPELRTPL